jgi:iron(III) transport system permease protein
MISAYALEKPGFWRPCAIALVFAIAFTPALVLLLASPATQITAQQLLTSSFGAALSRSFLVAISVTILSCSIAVPAGVFAALYDFPFRRLLLLALALPLLIPSFLTAIGLSLLRIAFGLPPGSFLSGFTGTVLSFTTSAVPLVLFIALASARTISRSQLQAARLAASEHHTFLLVTRSVAAPALLTAILAGVLTLSDPGPGQILGHSGAATEILVSFAAQYDFASAVRQCLLLAAIALGCALPVAVLLAPRLATGLLARDVTPAPLVHLPALRPFATILFLALLTFEILLPLFGFVLPLLRNFPVERAWQDVSRTLANTVLYGVGAAIVATALGLTVAIAAGRNTSLRIVLLSVLLVLFALPPALNALGLVHLASVSPPQLDPLLRGHLAVMLALAVKLVPITGIFAMRGFGTSSSSWAAAAALHGVSLATYFVRILVPWLSAIILPAGLLALLLAIADVSAVLLLHPPGEASLPLAIFTVMANAPESLVAALCLFYVAGAAIVLAVIPALAIRSKQ